MFYLYANISQMKERLNILASGGGSTGSEIIKSWLRKEIPNLEDIFITSSKEKAGIIQKALDLGIPKKNIITINPDDFRDPITKKVDQDRFGAAILKFAEKNGVTFITQNGWMPYTPSNVIEKFEGKIFNQHPAPVPEFGGQGMFGRRPHQAIIEFSRLTGRSSLWTEVIGQRVAIEYDAGVVVGSARVPFTLDDNGDTLQQRALPFEHQVQINVVKDFTTDSLIEIYRTEPIVLPGQEDALIEAKRIAKEMYPEG